MGNIKVLDCTLRDGGYVNNWEFGERNISDIITQLMTSKVDVIECGFLSQTKKTSSDKSIFNKVEDVEFYYSSNIKNDISVACMVNFGEYNVFDLPEYNGGLVDSIRVAFHKKDRAEAIELCGKIKAKGYKTYIQPMVTQNYSDEELIWLVEASNKIDPKAFYIVDSFGTMTKQSLLHMYDIIEKHLNSDISIGFHSHNNMQLSFSNAQVLMEIDTNRDIIIDSSVYGMGRGAGNLCTELITKYLNDNYNGDYSLVPILEIIDEHLMQIFLKTPWGYSVPFYIASVNNCHPNYASYLLDKQTISVRDIQNILSRLDEEKRSMYDQYYIESLYIEYQNNMIDDTVSKELLIQLLKDENVLVIAPGKSLEKELDKVKTYYDAHNPLVLSVNFVTDLIPVDIVFAGNMKRFSGFSQLIEEYDTLKKVIVTSNIKKYTKNDKIVIVNYSDYFSENPIISDNSGMMLLNLLQKTGVKKVALAGFDGFSVNRMDNYYSDSLVSSASTYELLNKNNAIKEKISSLRQVMEIDFITETMYE